MMKILKVINDYGWLLAGLCLLVSTIISWFLGNVGEAYFGVLFCWLAMILHDLSKIKRKLDALEKAIIKNTDVSAVLHCGEVSFKCNSFDLGLKKDEDERA